MQFYEGFSDGTIEMADDWLVECILCGHRYRIDRRSLHISVMKQGDIFEHYWLLEGLLPGEHSIRFWINHAGG